MPYMGSKRKLAPKIMAKIRELYPKATYFYDLFGGGGAMSFHALQLGYTTHYNELNTGVVRLLEDIQKNGVSEKYYKWIDRDTFNANKSKDTLLGGICKVVWSFGNNQKDYLFSREIEEDKRLLHEIIVNKCEISLEKANTKFGMKIQMDGNGLFGDETMNQRRLRIMAYVKGCVGRIDLEQLQRLQQLERLEQLERLQQLQQLQQLEQLQITNLSYDEVDINTPPEHTIIYLDPPYAKTTSYEEEVNHRELEQWIDDMTRKGYKIFLSSYEYNSMRCVASFEHRSTLSATANNKVKERLFVNE